MPVSSLNASIDYTELPATPLPKTPASAPNDPVINRVERTLDKVNDLWDLLPLDERPNTPTLDYEIPAELTISIVIPVYNERATILDVIARVKALPLNTEIVVVDDCSTDGTRGWLETIKGAEGLQIIFKDENAGKGAALQTGFAAANGQIIVVQDADLEYNPNDILQVIQPLVEGTADVAFGSRFLGDEPQDPSLFHRLVNRTLTELSNYCTGLRLTDMETCYKAFHRGVLGTIDLRQNRFGFEPEITAKVARRRYRVVERPISYAARGYDEGKKIGVRDAFNAIYCIFRYAVAD